MITGSEVEAVCLDCGSILTLIDESLRVRAGRTSQMSRLFCVIS